MDSDVAGTVNSRRINKIKQSFRADMFSLCRSCNGRAKLQHDETMSNGRDQRIFEPTGFDCISLVMFCQLCDGSLISSLVGRRDISSHCCNMDLCNLPGAFAITTTAVEYSPTPSVTNAPSCLRDIYVLVETFVHENKTAVLLLSQFISALASSLPINSQASLAVVTVVDVGVRNPAFAASVATDSNHEMAVPSYLALMSVVPQ
ncbi:hypothetical protein MAR_020014, partial [Mya arenaria]